MRLGHLRCDAVKALGEIGDESTLEVLTYIAKKDEDVFVGDKVPKQLLKLNLKHHKNIRKNKVRFVY
jgi:HEAT repeat protein